MILKIITPDQDEITKNHIDSVNVHLSNGYPISIYPRHIPLAAALQAGFINYSENGIKKKVQISDGLLMVENDIISCFVSWADAKSDG